MEWMLCIIIGYGLGCISPSYILSKRKKIDIRKSGTGNLGATNSFMNFGVKGGALVLILDFLKAFLAVVLAEILFPDMPLAGVIAGAAAVVGHIFPFYVGFRGGKGIASLGGFVLGLDWRCFLFLLAAGGILALVFNWGCCISFFASALWPVLCGSKMHSLAAFIIVASMSLCIIYRHMENIRRIKDGSELPVRTFLKNFILRRKGEETKWSGQR